MWKIDPVLGECWREGDLTLAQAEQIEDLVGKSWASIHPANSAKVARRIVAVMYAARHEVTIDDALGKLSPVTMSEFVAAIGSYDDLPEEYLDGFPPEAADPSTGT